MKRLLLFLLLFSFSVLAQYGNSSTDIYINRYIGNGANRTITTPFQPVFAYIKMIIGGSEPAIWKTPSMDTTFVMRTAASATSTADVCSLNSSGVFLRNSNFVNGSGYTYIIMALSDDVVNYGSYAGNSVDNRNIPCSEEPFYVAIQRYVSTVGNHVFKSYAITSDNSIVVGLGTGANYIQDFGATSFQVGTQALVNASGNSYYWWAVVDTSWITSFAYTGNGNVDRALSFPNPKLFPYALSVSQTDAAHTDYIKTQDMGGDSCTYEFGGFDGLFTNAIKTINKGSVTLGNDVYVNANGTPYIYIAWGVDSLALGLKPDPVGEPPDPCAGKSTKVSKGNEQWTKRY